MFNEHKRKKTNACKPVSEVSLIYPHPKRQSGYRSVIKATRKLYTLIEWTVIQKEKGMNCQVTNEHGRISNVCYATKEADLKMLFDFNHIIPTIERSRRDKIIKKVRKSVIARYLKAWDRERWISEMGLEYSGSMFFDSVLSNTINQCLVARLSKP